MTRSHDLFQSACRHIPGGVNSPVRAFKGVGGDPVFFTRGEGAWLYDADGKRYIDYVASFLETVQPAFFTYDHYNFLFRGIGEQKMHDFAAHGSFHIGKHEHVVFVEHLLKLARPQSIEIPRCYRCHLVLARRLKS